MMGKMLPSGRLIGGIAVVAAAVGIYLGTKIPGFGLGGGGESGLGAPKGDVVVSTEKVRGERKPPESSPPAVPSTAKTTSNGEPKPSALDVMIDGDGYQLRRGPGENEYRDATLDEILELVREFPKDSQGIRIRIDRRLDTSLPSAEIRIKKALKEAGVPDDEVYFLFPQTN